MTLFGRKENGSGLNPTQEMLQYVPPGIKLVLVYGHESVEVIHAGWRDNVGGMYRLPGSTGGFDLYRDRLFEKVALPQGHKDMVKKNFKLLKGKKFEKKVRTSRRGKPGDMEHAYVLAGLPNPNTGEMGLEGKRYPLLFLNTNKESCIIKELLVGETEDWEGAVTLDKSDLLDGSRHTIGRSVVMANLFSAGLMEDPYRRRR